MSAPPARSKTLSLSVSSFLFFHTAKRSSSRHPSACKLCFALLCLGCGAEAVPRMQALCLSLSLLSLCPSLVFHQA